MDVADTNTSVSGFQLFKNLSCGLLLSLLSFIELSQTYI